MGRPQRAISGIRYRHDYYGISLYTVITPESVDLMISDHKTKKRTLVSMGIISSLITLLLEYDVDHQTISGAIWENSRNKNDLADMLSLDILKTMKIHKQEEFE